MFCLIRARYGSMQRNGCCSGYGQLDPAKVIGIMGCFAQRMGEKLFRILPKHLDIICGTRVFANIAYMVDQALQGEKICDVREDTIRTAGVLAGT